MPMRLGIGGRGTFPVALLFCAHVANKEADRGRLNLPDRFDRRDPIHPLVLGPTLTIWAAKEYGCANLGAHSNCTDCSPDRFRALDPGDRRRACRLCLFACFDRVRHVPWLISCVHRTDLAGHLSSPNASVGPVSCPNRTRKLWLWRLCCRSPAGKLGSPVASGIYGVSGRHPRASLLGPSPDHSRGAEVGREERPAGVVFRGVGDAVIGV
jgi:hypothetical protein